MTDRPVDLSFLKDEAVKYIDLSSLGMLWMLDKDTVQLRDS